MKTTWSRVAVVAAGFAAAAALRYGLVEPEAIVHSCGSTAAPWWCALRAVVVLGFSTYALGVAAVVSAALAFLTRSSAWALAAAALGGAGLILYNYVPGAVAFLVGLLVLARTPARRSQPPASSAPG